MKEVDVVSRFSNFLAQDKYFNLYVVGAVFINLVLYICGVYFKSINTSGSGIRGDLFKLFLVWSNILLMGGLLLQKKIGYSARWIKSIFFTPPINFW